MIAGCNLTLLKRILSTPTIIGWEWSERSINLDKHRDRNTDYQKSPKKSFDQNRQETPGYPVTILANFSNSQIRLPTFLSKRVLLIKLASIQKRTPDRDSDSNLRQITSVFLQKLGQINTRVISSVDVTCEDKR